MEIKPFYDERTNTLTYVVYDADTGDAVVLDPVMDYDPVGSKLWEESVARVIAFLKAETLTPHYLLETHAHADHLSGCQAIKQRFPKAQIGIGAGITAVQRVFKTIFDLPADFATDGSQFELLLNHGDVLRAGSLAIEVIATPGHTPACVTYRIGDATFTGDALFMPDAGTGRCDFPGGSAEQLYRSITERLYRLPDATRVFVGHDYQPGGRPLAYESTIAEEKAHNVQLPASRSEAVFVRFRNERDATLSAPKLLFQSIQVNVDAGKLPAQGANERRYLKIPINVFRPEGEGEIELDTLA